RTAAARRHVPEKPLDRQRARLFRAIRYFRIGTPARNASRRNKYGRRAGCHSAEERIGCLGALMSTPSAFEVCGFSASNGVPYPTPHAMSSTLPGVKLLLANR